VFVADAKSAVSDIAIALQAAGRATIVAAGGLREENLVLTDEIEVTGFKVELRIGEPLWGPPVADVTLAATADPRTHAITLAKTYATRPPAPKPKKPVALPDLRVRDDLDYPEPYPSRELRALAAIKIWAVLDRFNPYRYLAGDWDKAFRDAVPKVLAAKTADEYLRALREFGVAAGDGHIGINSDPPETSRRAGPAIVARLVDQKLVVARVITPADAKGVSVGDVIETIDGKRAADVMADRRSITSGSTTEARDQRLAANALAGPDGSTITLGVRGGNGRLRDVALARTAGYAMATYLPPTGPAWRKLPNNIGFVDLRALQRADVGTAMTELAQTKAIVFDMRGYPNGVAWTLAPLLNVRNAKYGAQFLQPLVRGDLVRGQERRTRFLQEMNASPTPYRGKVVVLIDDRAISQSEHTCLFLQEAAGATFIGSPTAGANGDITAIRLPGKLRLWFTGQEVRHVDGKQLQKLGIQPHVTIRPTIAGLRNGKDEVLDRALAFIANGK
jgi:C-terminal processing protease CtpA/Prc